MFSIEIALNYKEYKPCISSGANNAASVVASGATSSIDIAGKLLITFKSGMAF